MGPLIVIFIIQREKLKGVVVRVLVHDLQEPIKGCATGFLRDLGHITWPLRTKAANRNRCRHAECCCTHLLGNLTLSDIRASNQAPRPLVPHAGRVRHLTRHWI